CFKFSCSTPQYFKWMEKYFPDKFKKIKDRVKEGRLELLGGMWIEPDMNLINGESIVRQRLYGQRYYLSRFGKISEVAWLSDTFGYNWQLPQILVKSGAKYFYTNKMSWNSQNDFPFGVFYWKSPDGSKILSYSFPYALNVFVQEPSLGGFKWLCSFLSKNNSEFSYDNDFKEIEKLKTKNYLKELGWIYGVGDGGGGPLLEEIIIFKDLMRHNEIKFITALEYFRILEEYKDKFPIWNDELYLEIHRGVYTTHAWIKEANRKGEIKLKNLEIISVIASLFGEEFPKIEGIWKLLLFNQFHDILPGSSIPEVYEEAKEDYKKINSKVDRIVRTRLRTIIKNIDTAGFSNPVVVFNTLNWDRTDIVEVPLKDDGNAVFDIEKGEILSQIISKNNKKLLIFKSSILSLGYKVYNIKKIQTSQKMETDLEIKEDKKSIFLENKFLKVRINKKKGYISSIFHKILKKEIVNGKANWIQIYKDECPKDSAWNIDKNYYKKRIPMPDPYKVEIQDNGPLLISVSIRRTYEKSQFVQTIKVYSEMDMIEFNLNLDFYEKKRIVKVAFPLNLKTQKFSSEIPFGVIKRPTIPKFESQMGRWEVSAQKWVDLTNNEFGVTLINSSKYGFNVIGNILKMTILRTPQYPKAGAALQLWDSNKIIDLGRHSVNYALKIHKPGELEYSIREAHQFNDKPIVMMTEPRAGNLPNTFSFLKIGPSNIILSAFKPYEDRKENELKFIMRIYESVGKKTRCIIETSKLFKIKEVFETDLLEFNLRKIQTINEDLIEIDINKFEIKTLLISLEKSEIDL
ncbi:MAG: alpha-mannosidase, partial [Candidatus Helarchaeota archaeon]